MNKEDQNAKLTELHETDTLSDYLSDWNLIYDLEEYLGLHDPENISIRVKWAKTLHTVVGRRCPLNNSGFAVVSDIAKMFATKEERCETLLTIFKLWKKK